ncbi:MAG: hypothetical protein J3K34DRAFT_457726 [Monoraphidium minutum]|nr:MAG: hypothetical protein J3K34DRAFT_457726 [Monoraphidium minutum]
MQAAAALASDGRCLWVHPGARRHAGLAVRRAAGAVCDLWRRRRWGRDRPRPRRQRWRRRRRRRRPRRRPNGRAALPAADAGYVWPLGDAAVHRPELGGGARGGAFRQRRARGARGGLDGGAARARRRRGGGGGRGARARAAARGQRARLRAAGGGSGRRGGRRRRGGGRRGRGRQGGAAARRRGQQPFADRSQHLHSHGWQRLLFC